TGQNDSSCTDTCNFVVQTNAAPQAMGIEQKLRWLTTTRGRVGYAVGDWLGYVTGGAAWGGIRTHYASALNHPTRTAQLSHTKLGWVVGTGIETALGGRWTGKLEYLYADLGTVSDFVVNPPGFVVANIATSFRDHVVRVGFNYNFAQPSVLY